MDAILSKITDATVYVNGALITRSQNFDLKKGKNSVKFTNLPVGIQEHSITVEATEVTILSVSNSVSFAEAGSKDAKRISELMKKLENLQRDQRKENATLQMLDTERQLLMTNSSVNQSKEFRASDIRESIEFFHDRMNTISDERIATEDRVKEINMNISNIRSELGINNASRQMTEVVVEVFTDKEKESEIKLSYFTQNANWSPYYDLRADSTKDPVKIQSKAMVHQHTGEDWTDVMLTLSTGNPSLSGTIPELSPWYLNFDVPMAISNFQQFNAPVARMSAKNQMIEEECCKIEECCDIAECDAIPQQQEVSRNENLTSIEYVLKTPYSIETSGNGRSVDIGSYELPAKFVYKSVRKLEKDVFLVAEIKEWEGINLLEGKANVFFEGKYVGEAYIDPRKASEEMVISLGRDKNVIVTRVRGKDFVSKSAFGSNMKASREWVLTARNLKKQSVTLVLEDQVPVPVNKSIVVEAVNISGAAMNKDTGKLEWTLELEPAASRSLNVKYEVTYPKDKIVKLE